MGIIKSMTVHRQRYALMVALGGKCSCIGENCWHDGPCTVDDYRCLQLDHIDGDGAEDRRGGRGHAGYYFYHLVEARSRLQVLCASCNWVKRHRNGEVKNGGDGNPRIPSRISVSKLVQERDLVTCRLTGMPEYCELVLRHQALLPRLVDVAAFDEIKRLERWGVEDALDRPMAFFLTRSWQSQGFYKSDEHSLSGFLQERLRMLDFAERISGLREEQD